MEEVRWLTEREERAWRALQFMQLRLEAEAAAPGHVAAVRHLVIDRLDPERLDAVGAAAEAVLAGLDVRPRRSGPARATMTT